MRLRALGSFTRRPRSRSQLFSQPPNTTRAPHPPAVPAQHAYMHACRFCGAREPLAACAPGQRAGLPCRPLLSPTEFIPPPPPPPPGANPPPTSFPCLFTRVPSAWPCPAPPRPACPACPGALSPPPCAGRRAVHARFPLSTMRRALWPRPPARPRRLIRGSEGARNKG